jgi:hypothetical protein
MNKSELIKKIQNNEISMYQYKDLVPKKFFDDEDVIKLILNKQSSMFYFASERLKNNKELLLMAMEDNMHLMKYASEEIKSDKLFFKEILSKNENAIVLLEYMNDSLRNDRFFLEKMEEFHSTEINSINLYDRDYERFYLERIEILKLYKEQDAILEKMKKEAKKSIVNKF